VADEPAIDPRFDRRFQRGYDPELAPADSPVATRTVAVAPTAAPAGQDAVSTPTDPRSPAATAAEEPELEFDDELEPTPRNPFRLALLLLGVGLLVLAGAVLWWSANNQAEFLYGSAVETAERWMLQQLMSIVPVAGIIAGVVAIGAWLAQGALDSLARAGRARPVAAHPVGDLDD
jgi:hypothetical protein